MKHSDQYCRAETAREAQAFTDNDLTTSSTRSAGMVLAEDHKCEMGKNLVAARVKRTKREKNQCSRSCRLQRNGENNAKVA